MPAKKTRTGDDLAEWEADKERRLERMALARARAKALSGSTLILLPEASAMLGISMVALRDFEARARKDGDPFPPRVRLSPRVTGFRLDDLEAYIASKMERRVDGTEA